MIRSILRSRIAQVIRLVIGIACISIAWLAVLPAPNGTLWMLAIAVTEWGHYLALVALLPLIPGWLGSRVGKTGAMLGLLAALLALSPLVRATRLANELSFAHKFADDTQPRYKPDAPPRHAPLNYIDLVRGVRSPQVNMQPHVYVKRGERELRLDLYQAREPQPRSPVVVVVHGGSWQRYDSTQLAPLNSYLAARGYTVAAINYRLSPEFRFPAARDDLRAAISFLKENSERLGIDRDRFVLLGRSAGGQLALLVAYGDKDPAIRGVIAFYAMTDLAYIYENPANPSVIDSRDILRAHLGGTPEEIPSTYEEASPVFLASRDVPATLLIHGGRDELFPAILSELLAVRLQKVGARHIFLRMPWATHGCDFNFSGPCGQFSTYEIERFAAAVTK